MHVQHEAIVTSASLMGSEAVRSAWERAILGGLFLDTAAGQKIFKTPL